MARIRFDFFDATEVFSSIYSTVIYQGGIFEDDTETRAKRVESDGSYCVFLGDFTIKPSETSNFQVIVGGVLEEIHIFDAEGAQAGKIINISGDAAAYIDSVETDTHGDWWDALAADRGVDIFLSGANDDFGGFIASDRLRGGAGRDKLYGHEGDDRIFGGDDRDRLYGEAGADYIKGGRGSDDIFGGDGSDELDGGRGGDWLIGGQGRDLLKGKNGNDILAGEDGADVLRGGKGQDVLAGGRDGDRLFGGRGADTFDFIKGFDGGHDIVKDFTDGQDVLRIIEYSNFNDFDDVFNASSQTDDGVLVRLSADSTVLLENFELNNFSAMDVILLA